MHPRLSVVWFASAEVRACEGNVLCVSFAPVVTWRRTAHLGGDVRALLHALPFRKRRL